MDRADALQEEGDTEGEDHGAEADGPERDAARARARTGPRSRRTEAGARVGDRGWGSVAARSVGRVGRVGRVRGGGIGGVRRRGGGRGGRRGGGGLSRRRGEGAGGGWLRRRGRRGRPRAHPTGSGHGRGEPRAGAGDGIGRCRRVRGRVSRRPRVTEQEEQSDTDQRCTPDQPGVEEVEAAGQDQDGGDQEEGADDDPAVGSRAVGTRRSSPRAGGQAVDLRHRHPGDDVEEDARVRRRGRGPRKPAGPRWGPPPGDGRSPEATPATTRSLRGR